jgi:hypothetical protein
VRGYLFTAAVLATVGLTSQARCQQNIASSGNISGGQQQFQAVNFATSKLAAPVSPLPMKNSQGSMLSNAWQKLSPSNLFKSSKTLAPPVSPTTKSASAKTAAQVTKTLSMPK